MGVIKWIWHKLTWWPKWKLEIFWQKVYRCPRGKHWLWWSGGDITDFMTGERYSLDLEEGCLYCPYKKVIKEGTFDEWGKRDVQ